MDGLRGQVLLHLLFAYFILFFCFFKPSIGAFIRICWCACYLSCSVRQKVEKFLLNLEEIEERFSNIELLSVYSEKTPEQSTILGINSEKTPVNQGKTMENLRKTTKIGDPHRNPVGNNGKPPKNDQNRRPPAKPRPGCGKPRPGSSRIVQIRARIIQDHPGSSRTHKVK